MSCLNFLGSCENERLTQSSRAEASRSDQSESSADSKLAKHLKFLLPKETLGAFKCYKHAELPAIRTSLSAKYQYVMTLTNIYLVSVVKN